MIWPSILDWYVYGHSILSIVLIAGPATYAYKYLIGKKVKKFILENYYT